METIKIKKVLRFLLIAISVVFLLGGTSENRISREALCNELNQINIEYSNLRDSLNKYKEMVNLYYNPDSLSKYLIERKVVKRVERLRGTMFDVKRGVKLNMDISLYRALLEYEGPPGLITSNQRFWNSYSMHLFGKAVDIRWNWNIITYLGSKEGQEWLKRNKLKVYIERHYFPSSIKKAIPDNLRKYPNRRATAPHIHIQLWK